MSQEVCISINRVTQPHQPYSGGFTTGLIVLYFSSEFNYKGLEYFQVNLVIK